MNWIFCWLPLSSSSTLTVEVVRDPEPLQPVVHLVAGRRVRDAVQGGEEPELLTDLHARIEAALLGQIAPRVGGAARCSRCPAR